jgi:hypothetical protein
MASSRQYPSWPALAAQPRPPLWGEIATTPPVQTHPPASSPSDAAALPQLPGEDVMEEIAHGGMGAVLCVRDHRWQRELAVKGLLGRYRHNLLHYNPTGPYFDIR